MRVNCDLQKEKSIPAIRELKDVLIASHTGSGKTYAYLLPIVRLHACLGLVSAAGWVLG